MTGHGHDDRGWSTLDALQHLAAQPAEIPDDLRPCLLIRPRKLFKHGMTEPEMWQITRRAWRLRHRSDYKYALCVHDAVVHGVWTITGWDSESDWTPSRIPAIREQTAAPTD